VVIRRSRTAPSSPHLRQVGKVSKSESSTGEKPINQEEECEVGHQIVFER